MNNDDLRRGSNDESRTRPSDTPNADPQVNVPEFPEFGELPGFTPLPDLAPLPELAPLPDFGDFLNDTPPVIPDEAVAGPADSESSPATDLFPVLRHFLSSRHYPPSQTCSRMPRPRQAMRLRRQRAATTGRRWKISRPLLPYPCRMRSPRWKPLPPRRKPSPRRRPRPRRGGHPMVARSRRFPSPQPWSSPGHGWTRRPSSGSRLSS